MSGFETYYLIDFENVHEEGLSGSNQLGVHDHIHIFSTENAPKISFKELASLNSTEHFSHIIPAGRQSLDMHLISYLGYLIGLNHKNCKYVIVSKDTDFDNVISFFKKEVAPNISITRQIKISSASPKNSVQTSVDSKSNNSTNSKKNISSKQKAKLNMEIQRSVSKAGYPQPTISKVASITVKHYGEDQFAHNVHNELEQIFPEPSEIYKHIKPILKLYSDASSQDNSEIKKVLNKAGLDNEMASYVISLITKHGDEKDSKQTIYRAIVKEYGQKQGLNIYNYIKKNIEQRVCLQTLARGAIA